MQSCLCAALAVAATGLYAEGTLAAEITYKAVGTINSPSPIAGETMTIFITFDPLVPGFSSICGSSGPGFIPPYGDVYPLAITSVTYSIDGQPAISLGTIENDPNGQASGICLASDVPTQISGQDGYANVYDANATSISGYGLDVSVIAQSSNQVVIVPSTELITDRPNLTLFERDLNDGKISGSALIYLTYDNGVVVTSVAGAPATLTSLTQVEGLTGPTLVPSVAGTMGTNGWYISHPTTLSWAVSGKPLPDKSGCNKVTVPDTAGTSYSCTATNEIGDASDTVLIKKDSAAPAVQFKKPANNVTYAQNQTVAAAYSCTDATSGVASCTGSVAVGADIPTTTLGEQTFFVSATDNAGNSATRSVVYSVEPPAATPVFSLKPGTYPGPQSVTVTDTTADSAIYYTLDGSMPTTSSSVYSGAISIGVSETLKAIAEAPGFTRSAIRSAAYIIQ